MPYVLDLRKNLCFWLRNHACQFLVCVHSVLPEHVHERLALTFKLSIDFTLDKLDTYRSVVVSGRLLYLVLVVHAFKHRDWVLEVVWRFYQIIDVNSSLGICFYSCLQLFDLAQIPSNWRHNLLPLSNYIFKIQLRAKGVQFNRQAVSLNAGFYQTETVVNRALSDPLGHNSDSLRKVVVLNTAWSGSYLGILLLSRHEFTYKIWM